MQDECLVFTPNKDPDAICEGKFCVEGRGMAGFATHRAYIDGFPAGNLCKTCVRRWRETWDGITGRVREPEKHRYPLGSGVKSTKKEST